MIGSEPGALERRRRGIGVLKAVEHADDTACAEIGDRARGALAAIVVVHSANGGVICGHPHTAIAEWAPHGEARAYQCGPASPMPDGECYDGRP